MSNVRIALILFLAIALTGCGSEDSSTGVSTSLNKPLLVNEISPSDKGPAAEIIGRVSLRSDCLFVGEYPAIWPKGTTWSDEDTIVRLPDSVEVPMGTEISGGGAYLNPDNVSEEFGDQMGEAISSCGGPAVEAVVFNNGAPIDVLVD